MRPQTILAVTKTPRPYQALAVDFLTDTVKGVLADPPGAGKTVTVSATLDRLLVPFALIVAPKVVLRHWKAEYEAVTGRECVIYTGPPKQREAALARAVSERLTVVTNYERFRDDVELLARIPWQGFAFDEAHRLKGRTTKQTKAAQKITKGAPVILLATGTPVLNRAEELWSYLRLLFPTRFTSYWKWVREHFHVTERYYQGRLVHEVGELLPGHADILKRQLSGVMFQRTLEEVLPDLPPVTVIEYPVEMTARERGEYTRLADFNWADLGTDSDGYIVNVNNALSKMTRFRQITSDWASINPALGAGSKVAAAVELVKDLGEQAVVFTSFKATAYNVVKALSAPGSGVTAAAWTGDQSQAERDAILDRFKAGKLDVVVGTIDAIGEGVDGLQVARHAVFIDRHMVPARNRQVIGRLQRSGQQASAVIEHRFYMEDTIDQTIEQMLAIKEGRIESVRVRTIDLLTGNIPAPTGVEDLVAEAIGDALAIFGA